MERPKVIQPALNIKGYAPFHLLYSRPFKKAHMAWVSWSHCQHHRALLPLTQLLPGSLHKPEMQLWGDRRTAQKIIHHLHDRRKELSSHSQVWGCRGALALVSHILNSENKFQARARTGHIPSETSGREVGSLSATWQIVSRSKTASGGPRATLSVASSQKLHLQMPRGTWKQAFSAF